MYKFSSNWVIILKYNLIKIKSHIFSHVEHISNVYTKRMCLVATILDSTDIEK